MKVSVLMSVYNGEKFLRESIESILDQTFKDFEFLIIDDASTDSSKEIILSYSNPRIRLVENATNLGLTKSLNIGLKLAQGEFVARMDSDDVSLPERLEKQIAFLDKHPDFALAGSSSETIDENGNVIRLNQESFSPEEIFYRLHFGNVFPHASVMFRKGAVGSIGGYDETFLQAQDFDLWNRLSKKFPIGKLDDILIRWRDSKRNISHQKQSSQTNFADMVFHRHMQTLFPGEKIDFREIQCFHDINILGWSKTKITLRKIRLLQKIHKQIIMDVPGYIHHRKLKKVFSQRLIIYLKKNLLEVKLIKNTKKLLGRITDG
jgi:glycosyltransferase involved in cell wall biosynthesis